MIENNTLVIGILVEQFRLDMMVPKRSKEAPIISEGLPVPLPFSIKGKQENMKYRSSRNIRVELKNAIIYQYQIPWQH